MSRNISALSGRKGLDRSLFEAISQLAETDPAQDQQTLQKLEEEFLIPIAPLQGAISFYDLTNPDNRSQKVHICDGTSCLLAGTQPSLSAQLKEHFREEELGTVSCLGRCHENSAFQWEGKNFSGVRPESLTPIFGGATGLHNDHYRVSALDTSLLTAPFPDMGSCKKSIARMLETDPLHLLDDLTRSGLRGRGGAGFPIAVKMQTCRESVNSQKYVVCNADEGDPGSFSDRYLLEQQPFAVLLGMLIAGYIVGADMGVIYIRAEYPESIDGIQKAVSALHEQGLAGQAILGSNFSFHFKTIKAQGAYICGEETALLASIEGRRPEVHIRPPFPAQEGLFGRPTLVNNVETLATLWPILEKGGAYFAGLGTTQSTGTKLLSMDSSFHRPGVYEVEMGTPLSTVIDKLGGGFRVPVKALHIGGPLGGLIPVEKISELTLDFESFEQSGFLLGHASIIGIPENFPMIRYLEHLFAFTAQESCGKCFPCRLGSVRGLELLQKAQTGNLPIDMDLFSDLLMTLEKGSLCGLGGGMPLPVRNALTYFADELQPYFCNTNPITTFP